MAFRINIDPNYRKAQPTLADRIAIIYAEPVRVPVQLPVPTAKPAPRPVFGKRVVR